MNRRKFFKNVIAILALGMFEKTFAFKRKERLTLEKMKELSKNQELVVAYYDGKVLTYKGNGIKPVFDHLSKNDFKNAYVFDKVTGRASALLLAYGKCKKLYTHTLSKQAIPILEKYNISYTFDNQIEYIKTDRNPTGRCIMETAVRNIDDADVAYKMLKNKLESLSGK